MTYEKLQALKEEGQYDIAPISIEMLSDMRTPLGVMRVLKNISAHCYLLESVADNDNWGRYTFLGYDPKLEITCLNGEMKIGDVRIKTNDPDQ